MVIVCKRRGYSYELKEVIELLFHKMTDDPMNNKDVKKVGSRLPGGEGRASEAGHARQGAGGDPLTEGAVVGWPREEWKSALTLTSGLRWGRRLLAL